MYVRPTQWMTLTIKRHNGPKNDLMNQNQSGMWPIHDGQNKLCNGDQGR